MAPKSTGWSVFGAFAGAIDRLVAQFSPADFRIMWRPGQPVQVRGKIARAKIPGIVRFFSDELNLPGAVTVLGTGGKVSGNRLQPLRLRFSGEIREGDRQRVRNYLMVQLG